MLVVTGTKRSGTSMWMQLMEAAGVPVIGERFMRNWESTIRDANPYGYYESPLRRGLYYATNPDLRTGVYLEEAELRGRALKVFIPGLIRTERAYVERVVATVRNWREYGASLARLQRMEQEAQERKGRKVPREQVQLQPELEWWRENYMLIRDVAVRRYPTFMVTYDQVLAEPEVVVPRVFRWLGVGDGAAAAARVDRSVRTQEAVAEGRPAEEGPTGIEPEVAEVFDELYGRIHEGVAIDAPFIEVLNRTDERLRERIGVALVAVRADVARRRRAHRRRREERRAAAEVEEDTHGAGLASSEALLEEREPAAVPSLTHGLEWEDDGDD